MNTTMINLIAFGIPGGWEWIVILVIALLIFGKRLPEVGKSLGKGIIEFKKGLKGVKDEMDEIENEVDDAVNEPDEPAQLEDNKPDQDDANPYSTSDEKEKEKEK